VFALPPPVVRLVRPLHWKQIQWSRRCAVAQPRLGANARMLTRFDWFAFRRRNEPRPTSVGMRLRHRQRCRWTGKTQPTPPPAAEEPANCYGLWSDLAAREKRFLYSRVLPPNRPWTLRSSDGSKRVQCPREQEYRFPGARLPRTPVTVFSEAQPFHICGRNCGQTATTGG
jgi:hypothetical protein